MTHFTAPEFWQHFNRLPDDVQRLAKKDFVLLKENPRHPSLRLKKAGPSGRRVWEFIIAPSPKNVQKD